MPHRQAESGLTFALLAVGCTSIVTQTVMLREFLAVFAGNELIIGIVLANWMILTGTGALLGRRADRIQRASVLPALLLLGAVLPLITVVVLRCLRALVFPPGSLIGIVESIYGSFLLLAPYCLAGGFLFSLLAQRLSGDRRGNRIAEAYALEAAGSIAGGVAFNLVGVFFLTTFQLLFLLSLVNLGSAFLLIRHVGGRSTGYGVFVPASLLLVALVSLDVDRMTRQLMFGDQPILYARDTPFGNLVVTRQGEQVSFFENGALLFSTGDVTAAEEGVHYAMIQHPAPTRVLVISGWMSGIGREVGKYGVRQIDYVETNPSVIEAEVRYSHVPGDEKIHVINEDARRYLHHCEQTYDMVLVNLPDPSTAQMNRYYTVEFFRELKKHLGKGGVMSTGLLPAAEYLGPDARLVTSSIVNTLRASFGHVLIVPGNRNFFIASDGDLSLDMCHKIAARHVPTTYVNDNYVDDQLLARRSNQIAGALDASVDLNRDFSPVAYYQQIRYWLSYFSFNPWLPAAFAGVVLLAVLYMANPVSFGLLTGGLTASAVEVVLLLSFQILYGYVYLATGIIITVFMTGLAAGSCYGFRRKTPAGIGAYAAMQALLGVSCMLLPAGLSMLKDVKNDPAVYAAFALMTLAAGVCVGAEFSMASKLVKGAASAVAASLYGIDLAGSAIGALMVSAYMVPLLGVAKTSGVLGLTSLLGALVSVLGRRRWDSGAKKGVAHV